jgi:DNA-binding NtrC family response regulator
MKRYSICLIEDDEIMGEAVSDRFGLEGFKCAWFKTGESARKSLLADKYDIVISDIMLPDCDGEQLFEELRASSLELPPYIFITGYGAIDRAVRLLKLGAEDYMTKPLDIRELIEKVTTICAKARQGDSALGSEHVLGVSSTMRNIEVMLRRLSQNNASVLITGESGVGKEEVARAHHRQRDPEWQRPFVAVNCGAIPENLIEAEIVGYVKGAFTGAIRDKKGCFEQAHGGTLFLDEIGDMPLSMQVKLLRAIQERKVVRIGSETPISVDIHLICATNKNLKKMVENGEFREDLYYRINVIEIHVPPLRERKEDILWLAGVLLETEAIQHSRARRTLSPAAEQVLLEYPWPGNIRELKHSLERACVLSSQAVLTSESFFDKPQEPAPSVEASSLNEYLGSYERSYIQQMLKNKEGRIAETAAALGISRKTLWEKMKKLDLSQKDGLPDLPV